MTDTEPDPEDLLKQSANRSRTDPATDQDSSPPLAAVVADALERIETGDGNPNVTFRDERLRAVIDALDETGELESIAGAAAEQLDRDSPENPRKSVTLRLLLRVGLTEVAPEVAEAGVEGYRQHQQRQLDDASL